MLLVKQELLAALANTLESFSPGAGAKGVFESPKVAAHGETTIDEVLRVTSSR